VLSRLSIRNPLAVVVNALTMAVGNVNDAPLELNALAIMDMRLTMPDLLSRITYHYRQEVLRQLYRILGSADFLGNPVGLFTNVSSGVADIFYEPLNGMVMNGYRTELGLSIAKVLVVSFMFHCVALI
jgi:vacuolar protein sorting-associated protein 13A/C